MNISDLNPHVRYAEKISGILNEYDVCVRDCRIFYVVSGKADLYIDNEHYILRENNLFYCSAASIYSIISQDVIVLNVLNFDMTQYRKNVSIPFSILQKNDSDYQIIKNNEQIDECSILNTHLYINNGVSFDKNIKKIIKEFSQHKIYYSEKCSALLKEILIDVNRNITDSSENPSNAINRIIEYIHQNYALKISNSELANIAGYHEFHLNRLFAKHTGMSLHQYILQIRLDESKRLLLNTDKSLTSISEETGFGSSTHFAAYFKQIMKMSPSEYRANFKNII